MDKWGDPEWERLVRQIRKGTCTPFLGAGASASVHPTSGGLTQLLIDRWGYPTGLPVNLQEVAQHAVLREGDPVFVKEQLAEQMARTAPPDFTDPAEPHVLLAGHPISVYMTTNYDDHMAAALRLKGKDPVAAVCPWYPRAHLDECTWLADDYEPVAQRPLVYHLHGCLEPPRSIVLAEQDYARFLLSLGRDIGQDDRQVVPVHIVRALARWPLLFIGYSLRDWTFRMLFHGLVAGAADVTMRRHVSVQLEPEVADSGDLPGVKTYLERYFDSLNISVFWGDARTFCSQLSERLGAPEAA